METPEYELDDEDYCYRCGNDAGECDCEQCEECGNWYVKSDLCKGLCEDCYIECYDELGQRPLY